MAKSMYRGRMGSKVLVPVNVAALEASLAEFAAGRLGAPSRGCWVCKLKPEVLAVIDKALDSGMTRVTVWQWLRKSDAGCTYYRMRVHAAHRKESHGKKV